MGHKKNRIELILAILACVIVSVCVILANRQAPHSLTSEVQIQSVTEQQTKSLYKLCKVWGYAKYRHPGVVAGKLEWDRELFPIMQSVLSVEDDQQVNEILADWLHGYPIDDTPSEKDKQLVEFQKEYGIVSDDADWTHDRDLLGDELCRELETIGNNTPSDRKNAYGAFTRSTVNMDREKGWEFDILDGGMRMLGLFRLWNALEYYAPDIQFARTDWDQVLLDAIPRMAEARTYDEYLLTLACVGAETRDGHLAFSSMRRNGLWYFFGNRQLPCTVKRVEGQLVIWQIGNNECGLLPGDVLVAIDGITMEDRMLQLMPYVSAASETKSLNQTQSRLLQSWEQDAQVEILRDGKTLTVQVPTVNHFNAENDLKNGLLPDQNIGYIDPSTLGDKDLAALMQVFAKTDGIVVDLRYYPSVPIAYELAESIKPEPTQFAKMAFPNPSLPGNYYGVDVFCSGRGWMKQIGVSEEDHITYSGKVVLLMDEQTQSQGEFTVMSLRDAPNAVVIGSTSAGADGDVVTLRLPGVKGSNLKVDFTGVGVYTPEGERTQQHGLTPDICCTSTVEGLKNGKDELIERAIEYIKSGK